MKLRSQLALLALAAIAPVAILAALLGGFLADHQRATFRSGTEDRVHAVLTAVDSELRGSIDVLRALAAVRSLDISDLQLFRQSAVQVLKAQSNWSTINLALPSGQQILNLRIPEGGPLPRIPGNDGSLGTVREALKPAVGDMLHGPVTGGWDFAVRVPVLRDGKLVYILSAVVKPQSIMDLVAAQGLPVGWEGMVVDRNGRIVARTNAPQSVGQYASTGLRNALRESSSGWYSGTNLEGVPNYRGYRRSATSGWTFAISVPPQAVDSVTTRAAWGFALMLACAIALALLLARVVGNKIAKPITSLASTTQRLVHGERVEIEPTATLDEVRALQVALRSAAAAQGALQRAEEQTRSIVDNVVDGVITIDARGIVQSFNRAAERLFGYDGSAVIGQNVKKLMPEPYRAEHDCYVASYLSTGTAKIIGIGREVTGRRKDGSTFPMELAVSEFRTDAGRFFTGIVRDISESKAAAQRLQQQSERLTLALAAGAMGVFEYRPVERTCWWSPEMYAIHGVTPPTLDPMDAVKLTHPDDLDKVYDIPRAIREHRPWSQEYRIIRPDGDVRWVAGRAQTEYDAQGVGRRVYGVLTDITERKRIDDAMREVESRFRVMADSSPIMIWVVDTEGNVQFVNRAYEEFFGVTLAEVQGPNWHPLVHPDDAEAYVSSFMQAMRAKSSWRARARVRRADGAWRWVESHSNPRFSDSGEFLGAVGGSPDITDQVGREHALREADRHKDEFLAMLSHELRNPLAALTTAAHVLRAAVPDDSTIASVRGVIDRQTQHMVRLIEDLLDVTRVRFGKLSLQREAVDLARLVVEVTQAKRDAGVFEGRAAVVLDVSAAWVEGDVARLEQIYSNLLGNALKFTPASGTIRVGVQQRGANVQLRVADDGPGIAAEFLPGIFDLFVQGEHNFDRGHGGLGLGLALVQRLAELHGGNVTAHSDGLGYGATFVVSLPAIERPAAVSAAMPTAQSTSTAPMRIVLVDDNDDSREVLAEFMRMGGHEVHEAARGMAALEVVAQVEPDVVLVDIGLPDMTGYELTRRLRALPRGQRMILVALSGYGADHDRGVHAASFDAHLVKPVSAEMLVREIAELASRSGINTA